MVIAAIIMVTVVGDSPTSTLKHEYGSAVDVAEKSDDEKNDCSDNSIKVNY